MKKTKFSLLLAICALNLSAQNDTPTTKELDEISVIGQQDDPLSHKVGEIKKSAKQLDKEQVSDSRDLVRHETGISVVETGRFGSSGYAIRGVDENRVAITIDGLHQSQTLSSQGFKEIFEGYGNFNNTRNSTEMETIGQARIAKGADSVKAGSGALGGSVMFQTKDARDYLIEKNWHLGFKNGYASANGETLKSFSAAAKQGWFDILVIKTLRSGHELENFGYESYDDKVYGRNREKADPYNIEKDSTLVKVGFEPTDEHRITFAFDGYEHKSRGHDYSYTLFNYQDQESSDRRHTNDKTERKLYSLTYENSTQTPFWDYAKITFSNQKIKTRARTDEYCTGEQCKQLDNPTGLQLKNGKIVDKEGNPVKLKNINGELSIVDSQGKPYPDEEKSRSFMGHFINDWLLDCSIYDCNGKLKLHKYKSINDKDKDVDEYDLDLSKKRVERNLGKDSDGKDITDIFEITEETHNGKKYKKVTSKYKKWNSGSNKYNEYEYTQASKTYKMIMPSSTGYLENLWKERDLDTNTKNLNLEFQKDFEILSTQHSLSYGANYEKTKKSMTNRTGFSAFKSEWWAHRHGECGPYGSDVYNGLLCPRKDDETSFLIPVTSKGKTLYAGDEFSINQYVGVDLNYRYDSIKYNSNYIQGVSPKIPDDMVRNLFIPGPNIEPRYYDYKNLDEYKKALKDYKENPQRNIDYFTSKRPKFKNSSYSFAGNFDPLENVRIQAKYSKGFRAPTTDEMFLAFHIPGIRILPNVDLKHEIARTREIALTFHKDSSFITLSKFTTNYTNFIDFGKKGREAFKGSNGQQSLNPNNLEDIYQNVNRAKAKATGIEINALLNFGDFSQTLEGFHIGYKLTKQKGKVTVDKDGEVPMNAIQPKTSVWNIGYATNGDKYGIDLYLKKVSEKRKEDTYNMFWREEAEDSKHNGTTILGKKVTDSYSHWLSKGYKVVDVVAYATPIKNLTFRAGIYNLTNEKYATWDSVRSIRTYGTMNMVNKNTGQGYNRFLAPGRNYKISWEYKF